MAESAKVGKWKPRKWRPIYEQIICLHIVAGISRDDLAKQFGYTPQHISNILNSEQADVLRNIASERIRGGALERADNKIVDITERLERLQHKALERVEAVMNDDEMMEKAPFAMIDRGLRILSAKGGLVEKVPEREGSKTITNNIAASIQNNNFIASKEELQKLQSGLDKALEVREIHGTVLPESFDGK